MKIKLLLLLLLLAGSALAQTARHRAVPGTQCRLVPPDGFAAATRFSGFQNEAAGASILVTELPAPVQLLAGSFTAEALRTKGMELVERQDVDLPAEKGTFFRVRQQAGGTTYLKQILLFGDSLKTVMVTATCPEVHNSLEGALRQSLLSAARQEGPEPDQLEAAAFTIDVRGTALQPARYMAGSLIFTTDGQVPSSGPALVVAASLSRVAVADRKGFALDRLKKLPGGEAAVVRAVQPVTIDSLEGYEVVADAKGKDGKAELLYQVLLFAGSGDYYIIVGTATEDREAYMATFRKLAQTFRRKPAGR